MTSLKQCETGPYPVGNPHASSASSDRRSALTAADATPQREFTHTTTHDNDNIDPGWAITADLGAMKLTCEKDEGQPRKLHHRHCRLVSSPKMPFDVLWLVCFNEKVTLQFPASLDTVFLLCPGTQCTVPRVSIRRYGKTCTSQSIASSCL